MVSLSDFVFEVGVAVSSTPHTESPSYTDMASYVAAGEPITAGWGRANEYDASAQPGRLTFTLKNTDGRFTMGNGSSPYAPLRLRRPVRLRVTYDGTTYPLWAGFIDSWGNGREQMQGRARISASDRLARAARLTLPAALLSEILSDAPDLLFTLGEPAGSTSVGDTAGVIPGGVTLVPVQYGSGGSYALGVGVAPGPDPGTLLSFTPASTNNALLLGTALASRWPDASVTEMTAEIYFRPSTVSEEMRAFALYEDPNFTAYCLALGIDYQGKPQAVVSPRGISSEFVAGTSTVSTTELSHAAVRISLSAGTYTAAIFYNGTNEHSHTWSASAAGIPWGKYLRLGGFGPTVGPVYEWDGQVAFVALYPTALSDARILDHANARTGWSGEASSDRFERLCRVAGLPSTQYATDGTSLSVVASQPVAGEALLDALGVVAEAEAGVLHCCHDGILRFSARGERYATAVGLTLDASKAGQLLSATSITTDDALLVNDITASRSGGATQRVKDDTSIDNYDTHDESLTLALTTDANVLLAAQWRLANRATPTPRIDSVEVDVIAFANSGGDVADLLNAVIGTRLHLTSLPSDVSATATLDLFVEGVTYTVTKDQWTVKFTTSPVGAAGLVLVLDSTTFGLLDTNVLAY